MAKKTDKKETKPKVLNAATTKEMTRVFGVAAPTTREELLVVVNVILSLSTKVRLTVETVKKVAESAGMSPVTIGEFLGRLVADCRLTHEKTMQTALKGYYWASAKCPTFSPITLAKIGTALALDVETGMPDEPGYAQHKTAPAGTFWRMVAELQKAGIVDWQSWPKGWVLGAASVSGAVHDDSAIIPAWEW